MCMCESAKVCRTSNGLPNKVTHAVIQTEEMQCDCRCECVNFERIDGERECTCIIRKENLCQVRVCVKGMCVSVCMRAECIRYILELEPLLTFVNHD